MTLDGLLDRKEGEKLWIAHSERVEELGIIKLMTLRNRRL